MDPTMEQGGGQGLTNASPNAKAASPEQQAQFDLLLGRARQLMSRSAPEWLSALEANPVEGAVTLGVGTLRSLVRMSEQAGQKVDPVTFMHVGLQFCKDIAATANAANIVPDDKLEDYLRELLPRAVAEHVKQDADEGLLTPEDKARAQQMLGSLGQGGAPQSEQPASYMQRVQGGLQ